MHVQNTGEGSDLATVKDQSPTGAAPQLDIARIKETLLTYRGNHLEKFVMAHFYRVGLGVATPEDWDCFEAMLSSEPEHVTRVMRACVARLSATAKGGKS